MNTIRITTVAISLLLGSIAFKTNAQNTTEKIQKQNRTKPILGGKSAIHREHKKSRRFSADTQFQMDYR